jgi:hypothetical protein
MAQHLRSILGDHLALPPPPPPPNTRAPLPSPAALAHKVLVKTKREKPVDMDLEGDASHSRSTSSVSVSSLSLSVSSASCRSGKLHRPAPQAPGETITTIHLSLTVPYAPRNSRFPYCNVGTNAAVRRV